MSMQLGLCYHTLEKIDNDKCKMKMLAAWLRQQNIVPQRGVSVLQAALKKIGEKELASRIMVSY